MSLYLILSNNFRETLSHSSPSVLQKVLHQTPESAAISRTGISRLDYGSGQTKSLPALVLIKAHTTMASLKKEINSIT